MKRILSLLVAGLCLGIFVLSSNSSWMKALAQSRYSPNSKFPAYKYRYGDLYGFSYLPFYKEISFKAVDIRPYYVRKHASNTVQLYSICDSYLSNYVLNDSLFSHASSYRYIRWGYEQKQFHLDSTKQNVLLLEMVERNSRQYLQDTAYIYNHLGVVDAVDKEKEDDLTHASWLNTHVFNKSIEENLEFNLFDYGPFVAVKEFKAQLNHNVFNRTSPDVVISKTRRQLYYSPTIDSTKNTSSFKQLSDSELATMVNTLNIVYRHYRRAGFNQVYLTVMPNPATILEPNLSTYNKLIPRLQHHPALQMPVIDVYTSLKRNKTRHIYQMSDSHWAKQGFLLGIAQIDSALATCVK
jgi:hypothetical protein